MTWEQPLLLVAIAVTFVAWRRARGQTERARAAAAERLERLTYTLEAREDGGWRGFAVLDGAGRELAPGELEWQQHGLATITMHSAALGLTPGTPLLLEPAPDHEGVDVVVEETGASCGRIPDARAARSALEADEVGAALVLTESRGARALPEVTILLLHRDVALDA